MSYYEKYKKYKQLYKQISGAQPVKYAIWVHNNRITDKHCGYWDTNIQRGFTTVELDNFIGPDGNGYNFTTSAANQEAKAQGLPLNQSRLLFVKTYTENKRVMPKFYLYQKGGILNAINQPTIGSSMFKNYLNFGNQGILYTDNPAPRFGSLDTRAYVC